jgi:methylated-DNA-[protein]-cysteine S-methyltransferase
MQGLMHIESPLGKIRIEEADGLVSTIQFLHEEDPIADEIPSELCLIASIQLLEYFNENRSGFEFPISQPGTVFQQKVWAELMNIPCGQTISYLDLARKLGDERVIRAAASANGKNNLAIVVPCHRVIGSAGKLVGYAGGLWRKKWLLEHEARMTHKPTQGSLF